MDIEKKMVDTLQDIHDILELARKRNVPFEIRECEDEWMYTSNFVMDVTGKMVRVSEGKVFLDVQET